MSRLLPTLLATAALVTAKPVFGADPPSPPVFPGYLEKGALSFDWFQAPPLGDTSRNGRVFMYTRNKNVVFRQDESTKRKVGAAGVQVYGPTFIRFGNPGSMPFPEGSSFDGWYNGSWTTFSDPTDPALLSCVQETVAPDAPSVAPPLQVLSNMSLFHVEMKSIPTDATGAVVEPRLVNVYLTTPEDTCATCPQFWSDAKTGTPIAYQQYCGGRPSPECSNLVFFKNVKSDFDPLNLLMPAEVSLGCEDPGTSRGSAVKISK